ASIPATSPYDFRIIEASGINLPGLMDRTQELNVPFDSNAYLNAQACAPPLPFLPRWPAPKMYPVLDDTASQFDVRQPYLTEDVNTYRDVLTNVASDSLFVPDAAGLTRLAVAEAANVATAPIGPFAS